jgi:hypothetical protein
MPQAALDQVLSQLDMFEFKELQRLENVVRIRLGLASEEEKKAIDILDALILNGYTQALSGLIGERGRLLNLRELMTWM